MEPGYKLVLDVWLMWRCVECDHRQETVKDEEWPYHCNKTMKLQPMRQFVVEPEVAPV